MRCGDELGPDRLGVHLLHPGGRLVVRKVCDLLEQRDRVLVAGPQALEVEHPEAAEPADQHRRVRAHHPVHRGGHERQLEPVRVDLPRDVHVLRVAGPSARDDRDVVEAVGAPDRTCRCRSRFQPCGRLLVARLIVVLHPTARRPPAPSRPGVADLAPSGVRHRTRPQTSSTARSSSTSTLAVAPQTVSPGSSKNQTGNDPSEVGGNRPSGQGVRIELATRDRCAPVRRDGEPPALLAKDPVGDERRELHVEDPVYLCRVGDHRRPGPDDPDHRRDERLGREGGERAQIAGDGRPRAGSRPVSSCASRSAHCAGLSPGSTGLRESSPRPGGTEALCERLVRITRVSPDSSNIATSTADGTGLPLQEDTAA